MRTPTLISFVELLIYVTKRFLTEFRQYYARSKCHGAIKTERLRVLRMSPVNQLTTAIVDTTFDAVAIDTATYYY